MRRPCRCFVAAVVPMMLAGLLVSACTGTAPPDAAGPTLRVAAAASLREVVEEIADAFAEREGLPPIQLNVAGSNTLARQIEAAPVAGVFLSADRAWVDVLAERGRLVEGTIRVLFENRLVIVARRDAPLAAAPSGNPAVVASAGVRHLALADPEAVPAGRYARAHLEAIPWADATLWEAVRERVVPALDVRAALGLARSDPSILGIVYRTDVRTTDDVEILATLEPPPGVAIAYHGAVVDPGGADADDATIDLARRFLAYFDDPAAVEIIERHGFLALASPDDPAEQP